MKKNMEILDRTIRIIIALVAGLLVYLDYVTGVSSFVLLTISGIFMLTSVVSEVLFLSGKKLDAIFIAFWAPTILGFMNYFKGKR